MGRTRLRGLRGALLLGLTLSLAMAPVVSSAHATRDPSTGKAARDLHPELQAGLSALADHRGGLPAGVRGRDTASGPEVAIHVRVDGSSREVGAAIEALGGEPRLASATAVEAYLPVDRLGALAQIPGVESVWPILPRASAAYVSPGVALHGATAWHQAGYDGSGVRLGVIDGGFAGLGGLVGIEVPATIVARCYTSIGQFTSNLADCANEAETHGTAVVETIADMAPGATIYVVDPATPLEEIQAVDWLISNGVRIINASYGSGYLFEGPGDGTSPFADSSYAVLNRAVAGGALWVNAAGNTGDSGWTGSYADADGDRWLEFAPGDEFAGFELTQSGTVTVGLRWADSWGSPTTDYDLYLYEEGGTTAVELSDAGQSGVGYPMELLTASLAPGRYEIGIDHYAGPPSSRAQLLVYGLEDALEHHVTAGTLAAPADSSNPGMLSIGAVRYSTPDVIEPYSSRGPTIDGRIKPDLVAADCAATSLQPRFCGTSQATPYVVGAAALLLHADATLSATALAQRLRALTTSLGSPVPNPTFGWGRLALGTAPGSVPVALEFLDVPSYEVAGRAFTISPAVRVTDASGRTAASGPGATLAVTLSTAGGELLCPAGLTQPAVGGVAVFADCMVATGGSIALTASATGLPSVATAFPVAPAGAPAAGLTLTAGSALLAQPGSVSVSAQLILPVGSTDPIAGRSVEIQRSFDGRSWATLSTLTTDASGMATTSIAADRSARYRAVDRGSLTLASGASPAVVVAVRQTVVLRPTASSVRIVRAGTSTSLRATVRPLPPPGVAARVSFAIHRRVDGTWRLATRRTVTADASGVATLAWRWGTRGSWYVRATALATSSNAASVPSRIERYDVR
ncbi:MAG TPA: S8 family serine peptidase [Candidatus Limnocylindrales bacterium]|nr:S8 family serine peptidase [Candidatus Limnocylindrales bacterium]